MLRQRDKGFARIGARQVAPVSNAVRVVEVSRCYRKVSMQSAAKPRRVGSFRTLGACRCICHEVWKNVEPPGSSFSPVRTSCLRIPPSFSPFLLFSPSPALMSELHFYTAIGARCFESTVKVSPRACVLENFPSCPNLRNRTSSA